MLMITYGDDRYGNEEIISHEVMIKFKLSLCNSCMTNGNESLILVNENFDPKRAQIAHKRR